MKTKNVFVLGLCGLATMSLAACGEGYEVVKFTGRVPYTEERTAGPGVEYVRAHLMPAKSVVVDEPVKDAAPIFNGNMGKGVK